MIRWSRRFRLEHIDLRVRRLKSVIVVLALVVSVVACNKEHTEKLDQEKTPLPSGLIETTQKPEENTEEQNPINQPVIVGEKVNTTGSMLAVDLLTTKDGYRMDTIFFYDNSRILFGEYDENQNLYYGMYNIFTGKIEKELPISNEYSFDEYTVCDNGYIVLKSREYDQMLVMNEDLEIIEDTKDDTVSFTSLVPSYDGEHIYYMNEDSSKLMVYSLSSRQTQEVMGLDLQFSSISIEAITHNGEYLVGKYYKEEDDYGSILINLKEKRVDAFPSFGSEIVVDDNQFYLDNYEQVQDGYIEFFDVNKPRSIDKFLFSEKAEAQQYVVDFHNNYILSGYADGSTDHRNQEIATYQLYDSMTSKMIRQGSINRELFSEYLRKTTGETDIDYYSLLGRGYLDISPNGKVACLRYYFADQLHTILWDLTNKEEVVEDKKITVFNTTQSYESQNDKLRQQLQKTYGVRIHLRDEVVRFFPDFAVNALFDEKTINEALIEIQMVLSKFPEGFFEEFQYENVEGMELFLCGRLVQGSEYGITSPGGFALKYDNKQMIVIDIRDIRSIRTTLPHEIMHAIDTKLDYKIMKQQLDDTVKETFEKLNPTNYGYHYSYINENGEEYTQWNNNRYTPTDENSKNNPDNIYFIDYYSNTFPTEDRSRIFETIMSNEDSLPVAFQSKHIEAKAEELCKLIRLACDGLGDETYWERMVRRAFSQ